MEIPTISLITLKRPQLASSEIPDLNSLTYPKILQPKLDGICCLASNGLALSRTLEPIPNLHIQNFFKRFNLHGFHGELIIMNEYNFNKVQSAVMSIEGTPNFVYVIYDYWDFPEETTYEDRMYSVEEMASNRDTQEWNDHVEVIPKHIVSSPEEADGLYREYLTLGYEGAILRNPHAPYKQGRHTLKSENLLKLKPFADTEGMIVQLIEGTTNTNNLGLSETGYAKRSSCKDGLVPNGTLGSIEVLWEGKTFNIGAGSLTKKKRQEWWDHRDEMVGKLVTFKYQQLSEYGIPRFPILKGIRLDC